MRRKKCKLVKQYQMLYVPWLEVWAMPRHPISGDSICYRGKTRIVKAVEQPSFLISLSRYIVTFTDESSYVFIVIDENTGER